MGAAADPRRAPGCRRLARTAASLCETAYLYAALRWIVFRDPARQAPPDGQRQ